MAAKKKKVCAPKTCGKRVGRKTTKKMGPRSEKDRKKLRDKILEHPVFSHLDPAKKTQTDRTPE